MANSRENRKEGKKPRNYWLVVLPSADYKVTKEHGLSVQGVRSKERKKAQRMLPGDRMVFYLPDVLGVPAAATVTSEYFEGKDVIWSDSEGNDPYPFRVNINADVSLEEKDWLDLREIGPRLLYVRRWTPEEWALAFFQGQLHLLPQQDFKLLEDEMRKLVSRHPRSRRSEQRDSGRRSYEQDRGETRTSRQERGDRSTAEQRPDDQPPEARAEAERSTDDQQDVGPIGAEQLTNDLQITEQSAAEGRTDDQQTSEQPAAEQQGVNEQFATSMGIEPLTSDVQATEQPATEGRTDDQQVSEQPPAEQQAVEPPSAEHQAGDEPGSGPQDSEEQDAEPIVLGG